MGLASGGYDRVALAMVEAIAFDEITNLIANLRNGDRLPELPRDTVIGALCRIGAAEPMPLPTSPLPKHAVGLVQSVKCAGHAAVQAALENSLDLAVTASTHHPLIGGVDVAWGLLERARVEFPKLGYLS